MIVGEGKYRYELIEDWAKLPEDWLIGDAPGIATDSDDRVFVFTRTEHPVMVFDRDGRLEGTWGEGIFTRPHGLTITSDGFLYGTDDMDHTVRKFTLQGELIQTIGTADKPTDTGYESDNEYSLATIKRSAGPFNRPTKVAIASNGDLFITDGYGNARVHHFSENGDLINSWGEPGDGESQFNLPHSIWILDDGRILVCDRENSRVQIFSQEGTFLGSWDNVPRPQELYVDSDNTVFIASRFCKEGGKTMAGQTMTETCVPHVSIRDLEGNELTRWGGEDPHTPGGFAGAHGIWLDSRGDLYVAEVAQTALNQTNQYRPGRVPIHKYARI